MTRLDDLVDWSVGLIKIDVEGGELAVLRGAKRILQQQPTVVFEHGRAARCYGTATSDVWSEFDAVGLKVNTLRGFLAHEEPLTAEQMTELVESGVGMYVATLAQTAVTGSPGGAFIHRDRGHDPSISC